MSSPVFADTGNLLLGALSSPDRALLEPHFERVKLERDQMLVNANELIEHVYFPEGGIASIVSVTEENGRTEVGIFGREGMSATALLLGDGISPHETFMQVDGTDALRIGADRFIEAVEESPTLRHLMLRYAQTLLVQASQCAVGNARHRIESRLARWLLMCHDRIEGDEIALTHEFMSMMIGAERSGVTVSLHILEGAGMIRSTRGKVIILNREGLKELAAGSYGQPEAEYRRLIGPFGHSAAVLPFEKGAALPLTA